MKRFEYKVFEKPKAVYAAGLTALLDEQGEAGWELCDGDYGMFIFKREITQEAKGRSQENVRVEPFIHMRDDHDHLVFIGDVREIHSKEYPDCEALR